MLRYGGFQGGDQCVHGEAESEFHGGLSILHKLSKETAFLWLSGLSFLSLTISCAKAPKHELSGRWQINASHGTNQEMVFFATGTYVIHGFHENGSPTRDYQRGRFRVEGDTLRLLGRGPAYNMQWKSEREILLVRDDQEIVLERPKP